MPVTSVLETLFPTTEMLQVLESKYGESVSVLDLTGNPAAPLKARRSFLQNRERRVVTESSPNQVTHEPQVQRKASTDARNPLYGK